MQVASTSRGAARHLFAAYASSPRAPREPTAVSAMAVALIRGALLPARSAVPASAAFAASKEIVASVRLAKPEKAAGDEFVALARAEMTCAIAHAPA